jgi:hypothetical protein
VGVEQRYKSNHRAEERVQRIVAAQRDDDAPDFAHAKTGHEHVEQARRAFLRLGQAFEYRLAVLLGGEFLGEVLEARLEVVLPVLGAISRGAVPAAAMAPADVPPMERNV